MATPTIGAVRAALRDLLKQHLPNYEVTGYTPDTPGPRSAWVWIEQVDYHDQEAVGDGYEITAQVQIQGARADAREAQQHLDLVMSPTTGLAAWIDADTTLGGTIRIAIVERSTVGFNAIDDATFAVATFDLTLYT